MNGTPEHEGGKPRENEDDAYATFMVMSHDEWWSVIHSLMRGGVLTPAEDRGFKRALRERGSTTETVEIQ